MKEEILKIERFLYLFCKAIADKEVRLTELSKDIPEEVLKDYFGELYQTLIEYLEDVNIDPMLIIIMVGSVAIPTKFTTYVDEEIAKEFFNFHKQSKLFIDYFGGEK